MGGSITSALGLETVDHSSWNRRQKDELINEIIKTGQE